jgi:predicted nuclease of predicted toxin-antitoxin system
LLLERFGPPPRVVWVRCGNSSNAKLRQVLSKTLLKALQMLESGERLVEINSE